MSALPWPATALRKIAEGGHAGPPLQFSIMDHESVRSFCLALPHVTEDIQWESDLLFRIGGKMFTVLALDTSYGHVMSFKCTPEKFAELTERHGIMPAPYVARYHWVALERFDALKDAELKNLIKNSYDMVLAKLPKSARAQLGRKETKTAKMPRTQRRA